MRKEFVVMRELLNRQELFDIMADMMMDRAFVYISESDQCTLYQLDEQGLTKINTMEDWKRLLYENADAMSHEAVNEIFRKIAELETEIIEEIKIKRYPTDEETVWVTFYFKYVPEKNAYVGAFRQMDGHVGENLKLYEEARKDSLTKLINKAYSTKMIRESLEKKGKGTLIIVDIDNFKSVNDTMGHLFGDEVIVSVANGLKSVFRTEDIVGRIGGDEFIVFLEGLTDKNIIRKKVEAICDTVCNIYTGENEQVKISASVGIAIAPDDCTGYNELFKKADHALYYTKNKGKNGYSFFDKDNEDMQKHHRVAARTRELANEDEEVNEEMDTFYFELNELAFRMLEETRDTSSAVNLILHKIQDKFSFSAIRIFEPETKEKCLTCTYEIASPNIASVLGKEMDYDEAEWVRMKNHCNNEVYVYKKSEARQNEADIFKSPDAVKSGVLVSVSSNNCFTGMISFIDCSRERGYSQKELKVLKSFERIFSVYKAKEGSFASTDYHLKQIAERDTLTGLYKYSAFTKKLDEIIYSFGSSTKLIYIHMDIAHFKYVNEAHGYEMGDRVLKKFVDLTCGNSEHILFASRIHGDNLIAVHTISAETENEKIVEAINEHLTRANQEIQKMLHSNNYYINCGICIVDGTDHKYDTCITNANYAAKLAKENADGRCVWFDDEMFENQRKKMLLLDEFSDALRCGEFKIVYQPQIDSISKVIIAAEALSRWVKEDGTVLMPDEYVDTLDEANKLIGLDYYVMNKVFAYIKSQIHAKRKVVPVSINLSGKHIEQEEFFDDLQKLLDKYGISTEYVLFEIREKVFIEQIDKAIEFCNRLKEMGIGVVMDSFGLGYSSLNILDKIPVESIKLDKVFIKNNIFAKNEEVILNGIIDIAKKLHKSITSLGVETEEQNAFLCKSGCDVIQGNFYSVPLDGKQLAEYIKEHSIPEVHSVYFSFDGTYEADNPDYTANANGAFLEFAENVVPRRKVLHLPGGLAGHEMVELSTGNLLANDFTVSAWFYEQKVNLWSSLFYADFENGFVSIMPKAWNGMSLMRVMDKMDAAGFYDAISTEKEMSGWTHIAAVYNAKNHSSAIFINGLLTGYKNDIMPLKNPGRVTIGGDIFQPSINGYVADFRIVNQSLSAKDIKNQYEQEKTVYENKI